MGPKENRRRNRESRYSQLLNFVLKTVVCRRMQREGKGFINISDITTSWYTHENYSAEKILKSQYCRRKKIISWSEVLQETSKSGA